MVFYRTYRPQKIEEIDNQSVRLTITSLLSGKTIPHAFFFTGPKGLGKTSTARIVAKVVNCEKRNPSASVRLHSLQALRARGKSEKQIEPCNKCTQCVSITNGTNLDVIEIDAASNRGIDEIRDLREKIRLLPAGAFRKVYIIDEVHMLTTEAFNALLKTLEEPPPHALFILCTTEPQKVPATIVSRCLHISFQRATTDELIRSFKRIVKGERLTIDTQVLEYIASLSDGSFRDGAKILEELSLKAVRKKITKQFAEEHYRTTDIGRFVKEMVSFLHQKDAKNAVQLVARLVENGIDMRFYFEQLLLQLHSYLLITVGIERSSQSSLGFTKEEIGDLTQLLLKAYSDLKYSVIPQLPLELAIIEWCQKEEIALRSPALATPRNEDAKVPPRAMEENNILRELIEKVKPYNHSVAGVLRGCSLKSYDGKKLVIETNYQFHKDRLEEKEIRKLLEKVVEEMNGKRVQVSVILKE